MRSCEKLPVVLSYLDQVIVGHNPSNGRTRTLLSTLTLGLLSVSIDARSYVPSMS